MPVSQEWVDRAKVVRIEDELARRRIPLKGRGRHLNGPCPKCGGDDRFWVDKAKRRFGCRHCHQRGGDVIDLVQWLDGSGFVEARDYLTGRMP